MDHDNSEDGYHKEQLHEHRKQRQSQRKQRNSEQELGDRSVLEQQKSPMSPVFDRPTSPFPHLSPTTDEHFFHVSSFSEPFLRRAKGVLS